MNDGAVVGTRELATALRAGDAAPLWRWIGRRSSATPRAIRDELAAATHLAVVAAGDPAGVTRGWIAHGPRTAVCADRVDIAALDPSVAGLWLAERVDLGDPEQQPADLPPAAVDVHALEAVLAGSRGHGSTVPRAWAELLATLHGWWTVEGGRLDRPPVRVDTFVTAQGLVAVERTGSVARLAAANPWTRLTAALVPLCLET